MVKRNLLKLFGSRKGHLDDRINRDYVRNGVVTLPCRVSDYNDVISSYSVKDFETLNPEFVDFLKTSAEVAPPEYPIVLDIIGDCLSQEEQKTIEETIRDEFAYDLGMVEKAEKRHTKVFCLMTIGLLLSGLLLWLTRSLADEPREIIYIMFWFMGETLCDYLFMTGYDLRRDRRQAGRLASIKVIFSDSYEGRNYTDDDVEKLYSEIEQAVNETIQKKE